LGEEHPSYAASLNNLAELYSSMGEYAKAEPLHIAARDIWKRVLGEEHPAYATSLDNLAGLYQSMGEYAKAEPLFVEARDIRKRVLGEEHPDYATSLNNLAVLYKSRGEYVKAETLMVEARSIDKRMLGEEHPHYALSLRNLAGLYQSIGEYAKAEPLVEQSFEVLLKLAAITLPSLSEAQAMAWLAKHRPRLDFVLSNARALGSKRPREVYRSVWRARSLVWRLLGTRRLPANASDEVRRVYAELQRVRKQLAQLTLAVPPAAELEQYRKRLAEFNDQKETLEKRLAAVSAPSAHDMAVRDAEVNDLMDALPTGVVVVDIVQTRIWRRVPKDESEKPDTEPNSATKSYELVAQAEYEAFVLTRTDDAGVSVPQQSWNVQWVHLGPIPPIDEAIEQWRAAIRNGGGPPSTASNLADSAKGSSSSAPSRRLRKLVWDKIEPHLGGRKTIVVIPDGRLTALPWAALPGKKPGSYLIEEFAIATAAFGQQLYGLLRRPPVQSEGLVLAGGIDYQHAPLAGVPTKAESAPKLAANFRKAVRAGERLDWSDLPGTATEAQRVGELFRKHRNRKPDQFTGDAAGELPLAAAMGRARYVHLATHGFFAAPDSTEVFRQDPRRQQLFATETTSRLRSASLAGRNPLLLSGVVLAGANLGPKKDALGLPTGEDGILTAEEVVGLDLSNTEMVVLSACETGLGDVAGGEGVFGLQRAFHIAGAHTVVASLWNVDDQATQELMTHFYRNMWEKDMGKLQALRQAQLAMLNRSSESSRSGDRGPGAIVPQPSDTTRARARPELWAAWVLSGDPGDLSFVTEPSESVTSMVPVPVRPATANPATTISTLAYIVAASVSLVLLVGLAWYVRRRNIESKS
jgi:CHAT domain-containing protein/tetratricopeptide (TPR) repeat protein